MSPMTQAMAPWEHELSQTVGTAMAVVAASDHRAEDPASAVTFTFTTSEIGAEFIAVAWAFEILLHDFDADCEEFEDEYERDMSDWRAETEWSNYELIGAAA
ncbi:hypothetical protein [Mycolicibacterium llatzerense]|uniref:hypothetical protein n=1 Tax=Mycolicibacterium llatzerense TaxID=280871 RepID=UPI0021B5D313|nr:hypothetical protein [Mycolicibacterium llatzerense]MCT7369418.1 hypothetical protein [Mycolicibacterium llatzerense]